MFYYCVTNYKLSILQQHQFIFSPFPGVRCLAHFIWVLHSGSCKAEIKMSATRESRLGFFQVPSGYWQNSLPCVCRTEDPGVFWLSTKEQSPTGYSQVLATWPPPSQQWRASLTDVLPAAAITAYFLV